jgi:hypothetical protein
MSRDSQRYKRTSQLDDPVAIEICSNVELLGGTGTEMAVHSETTGARLKSVAQALRQRAPAEGIWGKAALAVADGVEGAGTYVEDVTFDRVMDDLTDLIRRHPVHTLLIGAFLGFLLGRRGR